MKTVTFCGHSKLTDDEKQQIEPKLCAEIEKLIQNGAEEFLLGGYGNFDLLCAYIVRRFKTDYPHIKSVLVVPYINRSYNKTMYDCSEYPPLESTPPKFAISKRNMYMVDKSDLVLAVWNGRQSGGTWNTINYAKESNNPIQYLMLNEFVSSEQ